MLFQNFKKNWQTSVKKLSSTKDLALMATLIALQIVVSSLYIPVSENLHIGLSFLVVSLQAVLFGPAAGMIMAFVTDIIGFALFPSGPFMIGYAFSEMLTLFIYGCFYYQKKISIWNIIFAKTINNYLVNVCIGAYWTSLLYSKGYYYYFYKSLIKNTIMLPIEIALLYFMFKLLFPYLEKWNLIPNQKK